MRNAILCLVLLLAACGNDAATSSPSTSSGSPGDAVVDATAPADGATAADTGPGGGDSDGPASADAGRGRSSADTLAAPPDAAPTDAAPSDAPPRADVAPIDPSLPTSEEVAALGPHPVGTRTLELVDASRPTPPNGDFEGAPSRTLVTDVFYPATEAGSDAPLAPGPWPLVIYSHGYLSTRAESTDLLKYLASHGMVVAAPTFPLSSQGAPGGPTIADVGHQPGDVSFIIDSLADLAGGNGWASGAVASPPQVAAAGLSLGGLTTGLLLFAPDLRDERIGAFVILGGPLCFVPPAWLAADVPPALLVYGDTDAIIPYEAHGHTPFLAMTGPRALVTLHGGTHVGFSTSAASLFASFPDPDSVGCSALGENLAGQSFGDLAEQAGFGDQRPNIDACPAPCAAPPAGPKMSTTTQASLLPLALGAFLRGHFTDDPKLTRYVLERLPHDHPEVSVEGEL